MPITNIFDIGQTYNGFPVFLSWQRVAMPTNTTENLLNGIGAESVFQPQGYAFYPVAMTVYASAAITAGTATFSVLRSVTKLANSPEVIMSSTSGLVATVYASHYSAKVEYSFPMRLRCITSATYAPATINYYIVVTSILSAV